MSLRLLSIASLIAFLLVSLSCEKDAVSPDGDDVVVRFFRETDTVTISYHANPPAGQPHGQSFVFGRIQDTLLWSIHNDADAWIFLDYGIYGHLNKWEFAFAPASTFDQLQAPDSYPYFGATNYQLATYPFSSSWGPSAVIAQLHPDNPIILARRVGTAYPIACLRSIRGEVLSEATDPVNYYSVWTFAVKWYY